VNGNIPALQGKIKGKNMEGNEKCKLKNVKVVKGFPPWENYPEGLSPLEDGTGDTVIGIRILDFVFRLFDFGFLIVAFTMVRVVGFEPTAHGLKGRYSTD
jgi:hypothetical protein